MRVNLSASQRHVCSVRKVHGQQQSQQTTKNNQIKTKQQKRKRDGRDEKDVVA